MSLPGKPFKRIDGSQKVNGKAVFGNDIKLSGMLYAACRYSDIPAGKITKIDLSKALENPDVVSIATYKDIPGDRRVGPIRKDYYPIVNDEVFFTGDVIAVVAAYKKDTALKAANSIMVKYQPYQPVSDIEKAACAESRMVHPEYGSNVVLHYPLKKGDINEGFKQADKIIERSYKTGFQEHAYLEPETVTVKPDHNSGGFVIYGSIQNPYTTRKVVSDFLGMPLNRISVQPSALGGSFGGKDDVINNMACRTALMCQMTGKPVQMTNSREISMRESYKRHPYNLKYKAGYIDSGKITALEIELLADSGAYSSQTFFVTWRSLVQAAGPYSIPNVTTNIKAVYTNNCYTAAFRGFGSPQVIFAIESLMDEIADSCGITPDEIRLINALKQDSITATGQKLSNHKVAISQVINEAVNASDFKARKEILRKLNITDSRYKRGIGLSCSFRGCSLGAEGTDASSAIVSVQADGSVILLTGVTENGQGLNTTMSVIAAEELGLSLADIVFLSPNTSNIADGGPTVASRGTIAGGNAVRNAAMKIKEALFPLIKDSLKICDLSETTWQDGKIISAHGSVNFKDAVADGFKEGINLSAYGWFKAPPVSWNEETGQGDAYFTYVYGCQVAEITVDAFTGKINVDNITAVHDVGRVINLLGAKGQIYGGVIQGMGYAVTEDLTLDNGNLLTQNFDTYLIPTIKDVPQMKAVLIENPDEAGPMGAKSLGEPTLEMISAAVNNALFNALGTHNYSLPLSMENIFLKKKLVKTKRQSTKDQSPAFRHPFVNVRDAFAAESLEEALDAIHDLDLKVIAGGTDLIIELRNEAEPKCLMYIKHLKELAGIEINKKIVKIGAAVTFSEIITHPIIKENFPLLIEACSLIGSTQIRNQATIAGNLVNAAPCADSAPPLLIYDASVVLKSKNGERHIPLKDFIIKSYNTVLKPDELVTAIEIPLSNSTQQKYHHYFQLGRRNALNITRISICAEAVFNSDGSINEIKISAGSLLKAPVRLDQIEEMLQNCSIDDENIKNALIQIKSLLNKEIGKRWSAEYKIPVFSNMLKAALLDLESQRSSK